MTFKKVLEPILINKLEIKNRIFRPGHSTYFGQGGVVSDDLIAYHEARARAGIGLSTLEICSVHPSTASNPTLYGWTDEIVPGFKRISDAVHRHGMKLFVQLWHGGHHWPGLDGAPPLAPSDIPSPWYHGVPVPMDRDKIAEITAAFAALACRARDGGLDGVELHFGHGYLVNQFFSPMLNRREDEYGGSLENRGRLGREILKAVRTAVGADFALGIRISDQHSPGGVTPEECGDIVAGYCREGLLDFVNASMGSYHDFPSMLPAMGTPTGAMLPSTDKIVAGAAPRVARMIVGRYRTLGDAEQALRDDAADMIGINRAMIADPDFFAKSVAGHADQVRPCIGCNQGCIGGVMAGRMSCTVNPAVGHEARLDEHLIEPTAHPKKVLVIGGGPSGMEAARVAALSGHKVILFEAQRRLGGAINIARRAPKSDQIADIIVWLEQEIYRLGVEVRLSSYADQHDVLGEAPDAVIIATGSLPRMDGVQAGRPGVPARGLAQPHVYSTHDIYDVPRAQLGRTAVVLDDIGGYEALGITEYLAEQGVAVTFVTRFPAMSPLMDNVVRLAPVLGRLRSHDFTLRTRARLVEIGRGSCTLGWLEGDQIDTVPADSVVFVSYNSANADLARVLREGNQADRGFSLAVVGDASSPRDLVTAIHEGHKAARLLNVAASS